jgi:hypothetical protein
MEEFLWGILGALSILITYIAVRSGKDNVASVNRVLNAMADAQDRARDVIIVEAEEDSEDIEVALDSEDPSKAVADLFNRRR